MRKFVLRIRRAETPFFAGLKRAALSIVHLEVPVPRFMLPVGRMLYHLHWGIWFWTRKAIEVFYIVPVFRGRCEASGRALSIWLMPHVPGHTRLYIGDHVTICGKIGIASGRVYDDPTLRIGNHVHIGHQVGFSVNQEIVIEDHVLIAGGCTISDNDGHPLEAEPRARHQPPSMNQIKPVRIRRNAWLAEGCQIRKGVTVGEGAIVSARSVVLTDVPDHCIAMGNPARVVGFAGACGRADSAAAAEEGR